MSAVASPTRLDQHGRPSTIGDLRSMAGIATASRDAGGWQFGDEGAHAPEFVITVPDVTAALAAAIAGAGVARVPTILAASPIEDGRLEQVLANRDPAAAPVGARIASDAEGTVRRLAERVANLQPLDKDADEAPRLQVTRQRPVQRSLDQVV